MPSCLLLGHTAFAKKMKDQAMIPSIFDKVLPLMHQCFGIAHNGRRKEALAPPSPGKLRQMHSKVWPDLMLSNQISGQRAQELCQDALASGSTGVEDLVKGADAPHAVAAGRETKML